MDRFAWLELKPVTAQHLAPTGRPLKPPQDAAGFTQAARALREAGHFKAAADYYKRAVGLDERAYAAWGDMIDSLVRAGLLDAADEASRDALDNYRQVRLFYAARALVLGARGEAVEAFELSDISLEQNDHWYPRLVRAELLLRAGQDASDVLVLLQELAQLETENWEVPFLSGWMLLENEFPVLAAGFFSEAAHLQPLAIASWIGLGDCFYAARLFEQALFYYQRAIEVEPTHELALERQRKCAPRRFGLLSMFSGGDLRTRWNKRYTREIRRTEDSW